MCAISCQSATMLVLCSNVTVSVKTFTCASVRIEWSLDQLGRHINIVIVIIIKENLTHIFFIVQKSKSFRLIFKAGYMRICKLQQYNLV